MPRAGLNPQVVLVEAARLADEIGYEALTLSALAQRFGVAVPSLYKHVQGLDALRRDMAVLGVRGLGTALQSAIAQAPDAPLRSLAAAYRRYARAHPGLYAAALRTPRPGDAALEAAADAVLHTVLTVLEDYGLHGGDAVDATRALRAALHGFAALEAVGGFGMPRDIDRSFTRMVETLDAALRTWRGTGTRHGRSGSGAARYATQARRAT